MRRVIVLLLASLAVAQGAREYRYVDNHDIAGNDIPDPAAKLPFTKVCLPIAGYKGKMGNDAFKLVCDDRPGCAAVTLQLGNPEGCIFLKAKGTRDVVKPKDKWVVLTSQEKAQAPCGSFSPIGGRCTSDPWVDTPVCCGGNHVKCAANVCGGTLPAPGAVPVPAPAPAPAGAAREYRIVPKHEIVGNDIPSNGQPFTKVCGTYKGKMGYDALKVHCDETPTCVAAVAEPGGCGYLKTKGTRASITPNDKFVVVTSQERPQKQCTFSPLGGPCTTDVWVDQPVCCGGNKNPCRGGVCVSGYPSAG